MISAKNFKKSSESPIFPDFLKNTSIFYPISGFFTRKLKSWSRNFYTIEFYVKNWPKSISHSASLPTHSPRTKCMGRYGKTPFFPYSRPPTNPIFENSTESTIPKITRFLETVPSPKYWSVRSVQSDMTDGESGSAHAIKKKAQKTGAIFLVAKWFCGLERGFLARFTRPGLRDG